MSVSYIFFLIFLINLNYIVSDDKNYGSRIVGGFNCNVTSYPFIVSVFTTLLCGGSLITLEWVLTAAHCVLPANVKPYGAIVRAGFDTKDFQQRSGQKVVLHENYNHKLMQSNKEIRYDIALILLVKPFAQSPVAQPAILPQLGFTETCKTLRTAGVGRTFPSEETGSIEQVIKRPLKCVDLNVISRENCSKQFPFALIDSSIICTLDRKGKDSCTGDSGGPLFCKNVIVGIVSTGPSNCGDGLRAASNTKIERYLTFINENLHKPNWTEKITKNSKTTESINPRQQTSTSQRSTTTKKTASGSWNPHDSFWKSYSNILFTIFLIYFIV